MIDFSRFNTVSNYISLLRLFLAIPLWWSLGAHSGNEPDYLSAALALFASFTDFADGYLARKLNQVSEWGKVIDPLADKVCVAVIAIQMFTSGRLDGLLISVIVGRDLLIIVAAYFVSKKLNHVLPSNMLGKYTVCVIAFYTFFLMLRLNLSYPSINSALYFGVIAMSIISLVGYGVRAMEFIKKSSI